MADRREGWFDGDGKVARLVKPRPGETLLDHGPVKQRGRMHPFEVVTFTGGEESDVLHAAGAWMAERPYTIAVAMNGRYVHPDEETQLQELELVVSELFQR
ncbi:hypothetical protein, partial [Streptomyces huiliensis]|uniref:hypothetical protein n=1 Tax=Streptomyces huiliensis TaxID=2876027 RepID=UPI001CBFAE4D